MKDDGRMERQSNGLPDVGSLVMITTWAALEKVIAKFEDVRLWLLAYKEKYGSEFTWKYLKHDETTGNYDTFPLKLNNKDGRIYIYHDDEDDKTYVCVSRVLISEYGNYFDPRATLYKSEADINNVTIEYATDKKSDLVFKRDDIIEDDFVSKKKHLESIVEKMESEIADLESSFKRSKWGFKNFSKMMDENKEIWKFNRALRKVWITRIKKMLTVKSALVDVKKEIERREECIVKFKNMRQNFELRTDDVLELNDAVNILRSDIRKHVDNCKNLLLAKEEEDMPTLDDPFAKWDGNKEKLEKLMKE